jgi:hypothetical protein
MVNGHLVVTYNEVGLATAVAGLKLVSMTIVAGKKELAEGSLVHVRAVLGNGDQAARGVSGCKSGEDRRPGIR